MLNMLSIDSIREFIRIHPGKVLFLSIAAVLYVAFNVWVFSVTKSGGWRTGPAAIITEKIKNRSLERPIANPTPTPVPLKGPGSYSCSFEGVCNLYGDKEREQYCKEKETYADPNCLGQCEKKEKRCIR